jgi:TfoX/Sxy family transcriptional regulator of competence genes
MMKGKKNFAITERGRRALLAYTAVSKQLELGPLSETAIENEEQHRAEITEAPSIRE